MFNASDSQYCAVLYCTVHAHNMLGPWRMSFWLILQHRQLNTVASAKSRRDRDGREEGARLAAEEGNLYRARCPAPYERFCKSSPMLSCWRKHSTTLSAQLEQIPRCSFVLDLPTGVFGPTRTDGGGKETTSVP